MKHILLIAILFFLTASCGTESVPNDIPSCIAKEIDRIKSEHIWNPPAKVSSYKYNGKTVYYIPQTCCDAYNLLLDENCNVLCSPDGGLSGGGDGNCSDFLKTRTDEKLIWEDPRKQ